MDEEKLQGIEQSETAPAFEPSAASASAPEMAPEAAAAFEPASESEVTPEPASALDAMSEAASAPEAISGFTPETASEPASEATQKSSKKSAIIIVIVLVVVVALGIVGYNVLGSSGAASEAERTELPGALQPKLSQLNSVVEDEMENSYDLVGIADGKPLVINFWATWCPHCVKEMPAFQAAFDQYGDRVSFAMIDAVDGTRETAEMGSAYVYENGFTFPVYYDVKRNAVRDFGISAFPSTVVFDADGKVVYSQAGAMNIDKLNALLQDFVK